MILAVIGILAGICSLNLCSTLPNMGIIVCFSIISFVLHFILKQISQSSLHSQHAKFIDFSSQLATRATPDFQKANQRQLKKFRFARKYSPMLWNIVLGLSRILLCFLLGFGYASMQAKSHYAKNLPEAIEGKPIQVIGTIVSMPENITDPASRFDQSYRFEFQVEKTIPGDQWPNPGKIRLRWDDPEMPPRAGQVWQLTVKLKRPRSLANPGSFDNERYFFVNHWSAGGYVYQKSRPNVEVKAIKLKDKQYWYSGWFDNIRSDLANSILECLKDKPFAGLVVALIVSAREYITPEQWQMFQETGTNHLMAMPGLHASLAASIVYYFTYFIWKRFLPISFLRLPASQIAAMAGLIAACFYGILASFQRGVVMVAALMLSAILNRKLCHWHSYFLAIGLILLWDPASTLSPGFWLSFGAVGMIFYGMRGRIGMHGNINMFESKSNGISKGISKGKSNGKHGVIGKREVHGKHDIHGKRNLHKKHSKGSRINPQGVWWKWGRTQWVVCLGLMPLTLAIFGKISLIAPLVNIIAIPWISLMVVPCGLIGAFFSFFSFITLFKFIAKTTLQWSERALALLWQCFEFFLKIPHSTWSNTECPWFLLAIASLGVIWLLAPRGFPAKILGIVFLLPLITFKTDKIDHGAALVTVLDVGQGLSVVVETRDHVLIYDTGPKYNASFDTGGRVVEPYLKTRGIKKINTLIISHGDNDHVGGLGSLIKKMPIEEIFTSERELVEQIASQPSLSCHVGQQWTWEGVNFEMLHPGTLYTKKRNDHCCVLKVSAGNQSILLTGDIEMQSEFQMLERLGKKLESTVLLVPHHGSKTSSSAEFIAAVNPRFAIIPAGYRNQYGHPRQEILDRYRSLGIDLYNTIHSGAVSFILSNTDTIKEISNKNTKPSQYRIDNHHHWNGI